MILSALLAAVLQASSDGRIEVAVGHTDGDLRGPDAIQAAVDRVASLGGGTVRVGPGRWMLRNAVRLRSGVRLVGTPGRTTLRAMEGTRSLLRLDGDANEMQVTPEEPERFRPGDGVVIRDEHFAGAFTITTATLLRRTEEGAFTISEPLYLDYMVRRKAVLELAFPLVGGWGIEDASVEDLILEGEPKGRPVLDGCRLAGVYLFRCRRVSVLRCSIRGYPGDGVSFQVSDDVRVDDCVAEDNGGHGLHPGSGATRPVLKGNTARRNAGDALFVCWRVRHGLFEGNLLESSAKSGISIGHKDTDNVFRSNRILGNGGPGIDFRKESEAMGAHRNCFENNEILDNRGPAIRIEGTHHDLVFKNNTLGRRAPPAESPGLLLPEGHPEPSWSSNRVSNVTAEFERRGR